jgi:hypothetical protein
MKKSKIHQAKTLLFQNIDALLRPFAYFFLFICYGSLLVKNFRASLCGGLRTFVLDTYLVEIICFHSRYFM